MSEMTDSEGLNPGRDLRAEAKQAFLDALAAAHAEPLDRPACRVVMDMLEAWLGGTDNFRARWGMSPEGVPVRPLEPFQGVDDVLKELDVESLKVITIVAILTACLQVQDKLPAHASFYARCRSHLKATSPDDVHGLLVGL